MALLASTSRVYPDWMVPETSRTSATALEVVLALAASVPRNAEIFSELTEKSNPWITASLETVTTVFPVLSATDIASSSELAMFTDPYV